MSETQNITSIIYNWINLATKCCPAHLQRRMGLLINLVSFAVFLADLVTDIYVADKHLQNGDTGWFILTILFIITPFIIACCVAHCNGCEDRKQTLALARYIEAMYESAPQWCLQFYIMLRQWEFPWYTILSTVFSLLSLTLSALGFQLQRQENEYHCRFVVVSFFYELSGFISRLVVIAVFAYVFRMRLLLAFILHAVVLLVALPQVGKILCLDSEDNVDNSSDNTERSIECCAFLVLTYLLFPFMIHPSKAVIAVVFNNTVNNTAYYAWIYILTVVANVIMVTLVACEAPRGVSHLDVVEPFAIACVLGGTTINLGLLIIKRRINSPDGC